MMLSGEPPRDAAKEDGDRKWLCVICRFTRPVNSDRIGPAGTSWRLFTRAGKSGLGRVSGQQVRVIVLVVELFS